MAEEYSQNKSPAPGSDARKLQRLRVMLKMMCVFGLCAMVYVGISISTSGDSHKQTTSMRVELAQVKPGELLHLLWDGRPVIVLHRTDDQIVALNSTEIRLQDPHSENSRQPETLRNATRSSDPRWFVALASGTDLGCSINYIPQSVSVGTTVLRGAFQDSCRGSYYDLAGRVLANQSAETNLTVPDYRLDQSAVILGQKSQRE